MARPVDDDPSPRTGDRIAKLLARAGVASRREVERMIEDGRVALDGVAVATPATVLPSLAGVTVDGHEVEAPEPARLFLYHKPPGLLVTEHDPRGRPTIYDRLPADLPRVVPVGRLDLATEGLLLLTTDGGFKRQLELPATGVERAYRARAYGQVTQGALEALSEGVEIEGVRYGSIDANIERRTGANLWLELVLREGKNREVRRVLEYLGLQVSRLIRTRYGPFVLGDLPAGEVGEVRRADLRSFRRTLTGGDPEADTGDDAPRPGFRTPPTADRPNRSRTTGDGERPAARAARSAPPRVGRPPQTSGDAPQGRPRTTPAAERKASADRRPGPAPAGERGSTSASLRPRTRSAPVRDEAATAERPRERSAAPAPAGFRSPARTDRGARAARHRAEREGDTPTRDRGAQRPASTAGDRSAAGGIGKSPRREAPREGAGDGARSGRQRSASRPDAPSRTAAERPATPSARSGRRSDGDTPRVDASRPRGAPRRPDDGPVTSRPRSGASRPPRGRPDSGGSPRPPRGKR